MKIAVTGTNGLIGSRFQFLLKDQYEILGINSSDGINILDTEKLHAALDEFSPDIVLHFAAKTNVDGCEEDKNSDVQKIQDLGLGDEKTIDPQKVQSSDWKDSSSAFAINVAGTKNIVDWVRSHNKKIIYISTDFVFNGEKDFYTEEDTTDAINWYGKTKEFGEKVVQTLPDYCIVRIAYPYGITNSEKVSFVTKFYQLLLKGTKLTLVTDHTYTPTYIDDIIAGLELLITKNGTGIYHLVGSTFTNPYEVAERLVRKFQFDPTLIAKTTRAEYFAGKAPRPFQLKIKNDKINRLGFTPKTLEEGIEDMEKNGIFHENA